MPVADGQVVNKDGIPVRDMEEAISIERDKDPTIIELVPDHEGIFSLPHYTSESRGCLTKIPLIRRLMHKES